MTELRVGGGVRIPSEDLSWTASRSSGPGGQNVNKVATKVILRFDLPNSDALSEEQKRRLQTLARNKLDRDGRVVIISDAARTQGQNLKRARDNLRNLIAKALVQPKKRKKTKPSKGAKERRLQQKRVRSERKQTRARVHYDD